MRRQATLKQHPAPLERQCLDQLGPTNHRRCAKTPASRRSLTAWYAQPRDRHVVQHISWPPRPCGYSTWETASSLVLGGAAPRKRGHTSCACLSPAANTALGSATHSRYKSTALVAVVYNCRLNSIPTPSARLPQYLLHAVLHLGPVHTWLPTRMLSSGTDRPRGYLRTLRHGRASF